MVGARGRESSDTDTIVVGVDGSHGSIAALRWAIDEAAATNSSVRAVMSWRPEPLTAPPAPPVAPLEVLRAERYSVLRRVIAKTLGKRHDVDVGAELVEGVPAEQLIKTVRQAKMLVVGSRGYGWLRGSLLGSISMECVHRAQCPVVVIPRNMIDSQTETAPVGSTPAGR